MMGQRVIIQLIQNSYLCNVIQFNYLYLSPQPNISSYICSNSSIYFSSSTMYPYLSCLSPYVLLLLSGAFGHICSWSWGTIMHSTCIQIHYGSLLYDGSQK